MTKENLHQLLTGVVKPFFISEREDKIIDTCLTIINELEDKVKAFELKTTEDNAGLTPAEISCKEFFDINLAHTLCETNPNWRKIQEEQSYDVGRKLWLEIEIVDKAMSNYLLRWMYGQDKNHKLYTPFGAKLNTISFVIPGGEQMKKQLTDFINTL